MRVQLRRNENRSLFRTALILVGGFVMPLTLSGCLVAGYSSRGGGFIWPGGFGLVILVLLLIFFLRGRR